MSLDALTALGLFLSLLSLATSIFIAVRLRHGQTPAMPPALDEKLAAVDRAVGGLGAILREELARGRDEAASGSHMLRQEVAGQIRVLTEAGERQQAALRTLVEGKMQEIRTDTAAGAKALRDEVNTSLKSAAEQQQALRKAVEDRLDALRTENTAKLEQIRQTVDEKLQGTLEQRLGASFKQVSDQLEQVYKSVGEMQTLATGVGDLKKVLSNVRARGTWGEVTLGALLEQFLTTDQYSRNVEIRPGSNLWVEFAVRLPGGDGEAPLWLPVDAKFPQEDYERLIDAADRADAEAVELAARGLETRIRNAAKDISEKYISPPHSTDFAILFLPTEGLFAEVVRRPGLADGIQHDFRVSIAGPTTLVAMLNSLRMGFRTLAIQKRSGEVSRLLGAVKTEFEKYGLVLEKVQKKLQEASKHIDDVAVRRRAIDRKLRTVESLPETETASLLEIEVAELVTETS